MQSIYQLQIYLKFLLSTFKHHFAWDVCIKQPYYTEVSPASKSRLNQRWGNARVTWEADGHAEFPEMPGFQYRTVLQLIFLAKQQFAYVCLFMGTRKRII